MNANEPVAFWNKDFDLWEENAIQTYKADGWNIPLYTHPEKTYKDAIEECAQRAESYAHMGSNFTALAKELRAILRKVSEK